MGSSNPRDVASSEQDAQYLPPAAVPSETEHRTLDDAKVRLEAGLNPRDDKTQVPARRLQREAAQGRVVIGVALGALLLGAAVAWALVGSRPPGTEAENAANGKHDTLERNALEHDALEHDALEADGLAAEGRAVRTANSAAEPGASASRQLGDGAPERAEAAPPESSERAASPATSSPRREREALSPPADTALTPAHSRRAERRDPASSAKDQSTAEESGATRGVRREDQKRAGQKVWIKPTGRKVWLD